MTDPQKPGEDWRPSADFAVQRVRARLYASIRTFFAERGVLEVSTPILSATPNCDPHIQSFTLESSGRAGLRYLQTSPEYHMKRLLAAGSGPIYQLSRVFRRGEAGRLHNPEFTLLEWYRPGFDHQALMHEVTDLLGSLLDEAQRWAPPEMRTYREAFQAGLGLDPFTASAEELAACAARAGIRLQPSTGLDRNAWLDLLLTHCLQPDFGQGGLTFLTDFPVEQAALARIRPDTPPVAERFEVFYQGIELGNGYHELIDPEEQRARFMTENDKRLAAGLPPQPIDKRLLAALQAGLPACAGVALGIDRLLMIKTNAASIARVLDFPADRA
jgi:lysyl-tRNA synthetase class 2